EGSEREREEKAQAEKQGNGDRDRRWRNAGFVEVEVSVQERRLNYKGKAINCEQISRAQAPMCCRLPAPSIQQRHQLCLLMLDLIDGALLWRLIGAPTQQPRAVPEAFAGEMVVTSFKANLVATPHAALLQRAIKLCPSHRNN